MANIKTYTVKVVQSVISKATIKVEAKTKSEAKRRAKEDVEDHCVDWFFDRERIKVDVIGDGKRLYRKSE